jgi:hypothetical protein
MRVNRLDDDSSSKLKLSQALRKARPMPPDTSQTWQKLQDAFGQPEASSIVGLAAYLIIGAVLAMYIRFLYRWTSASSSADSIAKVFPLLTLVTIAVITVVKSSLALSLGLVGALSIVRFRAAIKDPEELVYLFLCIGVGLSLGAEQVWTALTLVVVASAIILVVDRLRPGAQACDAYLTIVGSTAEHFGDGPDGALGATRAMFPRLTVQRCDFDGDEGQLRVQLHRINAGAAPQQISKLRQQLTGCQISYVDTRSLL